MIALVRGVIFASMSAGSMLKRFVDLDKDRQGPAENDGIVVGVPGPSGQNDLVAGADLQGGHGGEQGRRSRGHAEGILHADVLGVRFFELQDLGVFAPPAERSLRLEDVDQFLLLDVVVELGSVGLIVKLGPADWRAAVDRELLPYWRRQSFGEFRLIPPASTPRRLCRWLPGTPDGS